MKAGTVENLKFMVLKGLLKLPRYQVVGLLESLWYMTASSAPDGAVGRFTNLEIAMWMEVTEIAPDALIEALVTARFLERCPHHRLVVHGWADHAPRYVKANLAKQGKSFAVASAPAGDEASVGASVEATVAAPIGGAHEDAGKPPDEHPSKSSQVKSSQEASALQTVLPPDDLDPAAWERWVEYRRQIRKPLKAASIPTAQRALAQYGDRQAAVVDHSIANGYQGLFPPKDGPRPPPEEKPPWHGAI